MKLLSDGKINEEVTAIQPIRAAAWQNSGVRVSLWEGALFCLDFLRSAAAAPF